ncbi:rhodanese-like domain-containing protein [Nitratiruptor sp. SB155-2]|uniref:rhodanese-like domain-containing protein n=1 Tax=Nitratiruptor sp. (strain SB155-2) TaxID=387092 RepID=UPI0001586EA5|nr:rhodanese-like domain-containing protein [Nitratiruptor sp. SB155-2]BAF69199.1 conserved hypothetical protein [Nitratiruptor sp. SB155-2]
MEFIKKVVPSEMKNIRISVEEFIELYNKGEAELVDIRMPFETAVWQVNFGLKIPAPQLPERAHELPKEKLIVVACPKTDRANMARVWLTEQGFDARYLDGGLLNLMDCLRGGKAKDIKL